MALFPTLKGSLNKKKKSATLVCFFSTSSKYIISYCKILVTDFLMLHLRKIIKKKTKKKGYLKYAQPPSPETCRFQIGIYFVAAASFSIHLYPVCFICFIAFNIMSYNVLIVFFHYSR